MLNNPIRQLFARFISFPLFRWTVLGTIVVIGIGTAGYRLWWIQPKVISPAGPALGIAQVSNTKPVVIVFSHPVKQKTLKYEIHPKLPGTWNVSSKLLAAQSTLTFTPTESPELDTRYTIALSGISSLIGHKQENYLLSFQTDTIPNLQSVSPANTGVDILPDAPIILTVDKPLSDGVEFAVSLAPEMVFEKPTVSGTTITFFHPTQFLKNTNYTLTAFLSTTKLSYATQARTVSQEKKEISSTTFTTIAAPGIQAYTPTGANIDPGTTIQLEFKQAMEHESTQTAFALAPATPGTFTWENDQKMIFAPGQSLAKNQSYTVTLATTAKAASGFSPDENLSFTFTTIGPVGVASVTPASGATSVDPTTTIRVAFNQPVVPASAESKFSIAPSVAGSFTWEGNTMVFHPTAALGYGTVYTATARPGIQSVKGLDSVSDLSTKFTTRTQSVTLNVPAYRQAHMYSCMIAAARSALAFRGVNVSESAIIARVGRDTTPWSGTWGGAGATWGDPDTAMVGGLDNSAATSPASKKTTNVYWGYGSHWGPIAKALTSYGVGNEVKTGMSTKDLAQSITDGNPVIIWWVNGIWPSYEVKWKTKSGNQVRGVNGLHVQVVRGFTGTVDNPQSFTVTDSGYGYPGRSIDIGTFKAKWGWFENTGIVVK